MILRVLILHARSAVNKKLGSLCLRCHVGKLELGVLELCDCATKLLSFFYVSNRAVKRALADTERLCRNTDTPAVERVHCDTEALALLS